MISYNKLKNAPGGVFLHALCALIGRNSYLSLSAILQKNTTIIAIISIYKDEVKFLYFMAINNTSFVVCYKFFAATILQLYG